MYTSMLPIKRENLKVTWRASTFCRFYFFMVLDALYPPKTWKQDNSCLGMRWGRFWRIEKNQKQLLNWQCCLQTPVKYILQTLSLKRCCCCCCHSGLLQCARVSSVGSVPSSNKRWKRGSTLETCRYGEGKYQVGSFTCSNIRCATTLILCWKIEASTKAVG